LAILEIRKYPDPVLREVSRPIEIIDKKVRILAKDMAETMRNANGLGLAAPQVGMAVRMVVIEFDLEKHDPRVLVNPVIVKRIGRREERDEGCLSFPELRSQVKRSPRVICQAQNLEGEIVRHDVEGLIARAMQHETDHLDGMLFVDKVGPSDKQSLRRDLAEMERNWSETHSGR
jgi:peptide deformylase